MSRSFTSSLKYPTLFQVLFSPHTPYVPPRASPLAMFAWRQRVWFESTFGLVAMEPWEKYIIVAFLLIFYCMARVGLVVAYRILSSIGVLGFKLAITLPHDPAAVQNSTLTVS